MHSNQNVYTLRCKKKLLPGYLLETDEFQKVLYLPSPWTTRGKGWLWWASGMSISSQRRAVTAGRRIIRKGSAIGRGCLANNRVFADNWVSNLIA